MRPAMQAFPPVSRCAAGALDRDTGQAGLGKRGDEPRLTPNSASCRVRFRFAAGEPKAEGTWPLRINDDMPLSDCGFQHSRDAPVKANDVTDNPSTNHPTLLGRASKLKPEGALNAENI